MSGGRKTSSGHRVFRHAASFFWGFLLSDVSGLLVESQGPVFVSEPRSSVEFSNETGALLQCVAQGSPPPRVDWLHGDGSPLAPVPHIRELLANGSLHFPPFGAESYRHDVHSAVYRCEASNAVGRILSREVNVRAVVKQHYDVQVHDSFVLNGNTAVLKCEVPAFVKDHVAITSWVQDSSFNIYPTPDSDGKYHMLPSGELVMYSVAPGDSHSTYRCRTVHHVTGKSVESLSHGRVVVTEHRGMVAPRFNERLVLGPVRDGETVALSCVSQGYPPPTYWWHRDTGDGISEVVSPNERTHLRDGVLVLENVHAGDAGRYVCLANNSAGSERVELELSIVEPVSVHVSPQQVTVDLDRGTEFTCTVSGRPYPVLSWTKDGQPIRDSDVYRVRIVGASGSRLQLSVVTREDRGMYQCFAKNDFEMVQSTAELRLGDAAPQLVYKFIEQTMQPGPSVSLKCIAAGNPTPHFTWSLDGFPLPHIDRLMIGQYVTVHGDVISHVNVSSVRVEDGGEYQCLASNRVGSSEHSARLNIYGLPHVRTMSPIAAVAGKDLVVKCPVAGFPISAISWEKDGQPLPIYRRQEVSTNGTLLVRHVDSASDRGSYKCTARNKQGHHDSKTVHIDVKVAPRWLVEPQDVQAAEGVALFSMNCQAEGFPLPSITWRRAQGMRPGNYHDIDFGGSQDFRLQSNGSLLISRLGEHEGYYLCEAVNGIGSGLSKIIYLTVNAPAHFLMKQKNQTARLGSITTLQCKVQGDNPLKIVWRKAGSTIDLANTHYRFNVKDVNISGGLASVLTISNTDRSDGGRYACFASNSFGQDQMSVHLYVQGLRCDNRWRSTRGSPKKCSS